MSAVLIQRSADSLDGTNHCCRAVRTILTGPVENLKALNNLQDLFLTKTQITDAHFRSASKTQGSKTPRFKKRAKSDADCAPQGRLAWTAVH